MRTGPVPALFLALAVSCQLCGCIHWNSDFSRGEQSLSADAAEGLYRDATLLAKVAVDAGTLSRAIAAFEEVLLADGSHYGALTSLSTYHLLLGDGYMADEAEKIEHFRKALRYAERAMAVNPAFRERLDSGDAVWEAVDVLTVDEMGAMLFWTTAIFYYYKEGLGPIGQVINFRWIGRARRVMERMIELDPEWGGGSILFTWGLYYLAIPESVGGNRALSEEYFEKAIAAGPGWLLNRWGRAKYFHTKMGNPERFREDLQWVLDQDVEAAGGSPAWKAYFVEDARSMLDRMDEYF